MGRKLEADCRYTNLFLASDPRPPAQGRVRVSATLSNGLIAWPCGWGISPASGVAPDACVRLGTFREIHDGCCNAVPGSQRDASHSEMYARAIELANW